MYRPSIGIGMKARYQGISREPPEFHDVTKRRNGHEEQWHTRIETLILQAIKHEGDIAKEYDVLLEEIKIIPADLNTRARLSEIIEHIKRQKIAHIGLLRRLRG